MSAEATVRTTNTRRVTLPIYQLSCPGSDPALIERALSREAGVRHVYVNPATEMAYVEYDACACSEGRLAHALDEAGFGPPPIASTKALPTGLSTLPRPGLDVGRAALAAGFWFAAFYTVCISLSLLFPSIFHLRVLWEILLVGFDWTRPYSLLLGLAEAFLYGAAGAGAFAWLYNYLPSWRPQS